MIHIVSPTKHSGSNVNPWMPVISAVNFLKPITEQETKQIAKIPPDQAP